MKIPLFKRGIFIVLIHKFREEVGEELEALEKSLALTPSERETISNRRNVIVLIDEGHRTQYGKLAAEMKKILSNAFFFAFTGTPLSKDGRDTYLTFSYPPQEFYLHKYFIADSIKEGFTLPIVIQTRMEKEVGLKKELLQQFLDSQLEEIPDNIREIVKGEIGAKLNEVVLFLTNPARIEKVARDIAEHFKQEVDGKFKAMVVAANRMGCVLYKKELDKYLPPEYSEVVMTFNANDPEPISSYYMSLHDRFAGKDQNQIRKEIIERFKEEEFPKILIVTDMLLTGFDAPILQVMYLDKPLKEHRLLQAIARTNRPCGEGKACGLIIDYIGVMKELEKAFAIYAKEDIKYAVIDLQEKIKEFRNLLRNIVTMLGGIGGKDRGSIMSKVKLLFHNLELEDRFILDYKSLRKLYEFLGPRYLSKEEIEAYEFLTAVYEFYKRYTGVREEEPELEAYVAKYFPRTLEAIQKTLRVEMKEEFPELKLDAEYLRKLGEKKGIGEAIYDITATLNRFVLVPRAKDPIYEPLIERIERLVNEWRNRKVTEKEAYQRLLELVQEASELERREKELGLEREAFFVLSVLEHHLGKSRQLAEEIRGLWSELNQTGKLFKGWNRKSSVLKEVMREIRRYLRKKGLPIEEREAICDEISKGLKIL
jgi:type I restriction enzyme R subunit